MTIGYDQPLYILPFDHRGTFQKNMFGWTGSLIAEQTAKITAMKHIIYDGFKAALAGGVPESKAGILVDEQFGTEILRDAAACGYVTACTVEKSGQDEFDFEYGDDFARHIESFQPTFSKVLVRYNPEGDPAMNRRQAQRLKRLSDCLHSGGRTRFMFELLVPALPAQLERFRGQQEGLRPGAETRSDGAGDHGAARCGYRAGRLEDRGDRPDRRLRSGRRSRAARRA
jgi:5-dehydro-2-deoxygluconokinase